jgi:sulfoquinovose isomerase
MSTGRHREELAKATHAVDQPTPLPPGHEAPTGSWRHLAAHRGWLDGEFARLLAFSSDPRHPRGGFAWLDDDGRARADAPVHTWISARMTHVHALGTLRGVPGSAPLVDHGLEALDGLLHDRDHGGWYAAVAPDGAPVGRKEAYTHAFVVLAAASAVAAGRAGAGGLLDGALAVLEERFWDDGAGLVTESFAPDFGDEEPYRGANSNMHTVEALLAAGDVTGDRRWHERALSIATFLVDGVARSHRWRLVEHFDADWSPVPTYNHDEPDDPFRPFGTTIGHWLEWARLLLHLEASLDAPPAWLSEAATALFHTAVTVGWGADGAPGFPYTLGPEDRPVVRARLHWVVAEAIGAAAALHERFGDPLYEAWYRACWDHAVAFIDRARGSWHHELTPELTPASGTWGGKPDLYHAVQATLVPQLALTPALAPQLARLAAGRT